MIDVLIFLAYTSLCLISRKTDMETYDKNISNENYAKLMNYFSKMKELDQIVLSKEHSASIKEHRCLTRGHLGNPEGQVEVESPLIESYF